MTAEPLKAEVTPLSVSVADPADASMAVRGCWNLFWLSLRRQFWSRQTLINLALSVLVALIVFAWSLQEFKTPRKLADQVLLTTFVGFLMPVFAISYGSASIGGEREDRTLIYLLLMPLPKWAAYLAKGLGSLLLAASWTAATLALFCWLAGDMAWPLFSVFFWPSLGGVAAYTALFLFFGTAFRHGTILSLSYWFFLEVLFAMVPGLVKRITVSFYVKSAIYAAGETFRLGPQSRLGREMFLAVSGSTALAMLWALAFCLFLWGALVFRWKEFRELG